MADQYDYVNRLDELLDKLEKLRDDLESEDFEDDEPDCYDASRDQAEMELNRFGLTLYRDYSPAEVEEIRRAVYQALSPLLG